jgi:hypothetical protein
MGSESAGATFDAEHPVEVAGRTCPGANGGGGRDELAQGQGQGDGNRDPGIGRRVPWCLDPVASAERQGGDKDAGGAGEDCDPGTGGRYPPAAARCRCRRPVPQLGVEVELALADRR